MRFIATVVLIALVGGCSKTEPPPSSPQPQLSYEMVDEMQKTGAMKKGPAPATKPAAK